VSKKTKTSYMVHIPKTAGMSTRTYLRHFGLITNKGHIKAQRMHHFGISKASRPVGSQKSWKTPYFPSYIEDPLYKKADLSFTIVRNPFDLLVSYYFHGAEGKDLGWGNCKRYHKFKTFEQFIKFYCEEDVNEWHVPALSENLFGQIFNDKGELCVDYVLFYENLRDNIRELVELLTEDYEGGTDKFIKNTGNKQLGGRNKSVRRKEGDYQSYYTPEMIQMVEEKCKWELETFEYSFMKNRVWNFENFFGPTSDRKIMKLKDIIKK